MHVGHVNDVLALNVLDDGRIVSGSRDKLIMIWDYDHAVIRKEFFVKLKRTDVKSWKTILIIGLYDKNEKIKTITAKFIGPEVYD